MSNKDDLFEVWNNACEYYSIPEDVIIHWFQRIRNKLSETVAETGCKRIYYNWSDMLVPKCKELKLCPAHVVLAAFFQYYEYDLNKCCVKENCEIFNQFYKDSKISNEVMRATVCYLLGDQESERVACTIDEDMALLQDLDLLILAATEDVYKHYAELSRQEWQAAGHHNYNDLRRKNNGQAATGSLYHRKKKFRNSSFKQQRQRDKQTRKKLERRIKKRKLRRFKQLERRDPLFFVQKLLKIARNTSHRRKQRYFQMGKEQSTQTIDLVNNDHSDHNEQRDNYDKSRKFTKNKNSNNEDDDNDCILVEPKIYCITIDDDNSPDKVKNSTPVKQNRAKKRRLLTSKQTQSLEGNDRNNLYIEDAKGSSDNKFPSHYYTSNPSKLTEENIKVSWEPKSNSQEAIANNCSNEIISLDDTVVDEEGVNNDPPNSSSSVSLQNSLEFVGEMRLDDFIPLNSTKPLQPLKDTNDNAEPPHKKRFKQSNIPFTDRELKQLHNYNSNAYNPNAHETPVSAKRMIIIDGSNVAFSHHHNKGFSVKGIKIAIEYFERLGHEVKAVIPQYRLQSFKSTDPKELNRLHNNGKIVLTPCKSLIGKSTTSYDDRFILQLACELDAVILSNDNYRDLVHENSAFKKIIENRVLGYTWCNDIFILPKDPYGKWGPPLNALLNRY